VTNFKNFFLGSGHDREVRETLRMHGAVLAALHRYPLAEQKARTEFIIDTAYEAAEQSGRIPPRSLIMAMCELIEGILAFDAPSDFPEPGVIATLSMEEGVALRADLSRTLRLVEDWDRISTLWKRKVTSVIAGILADLGAAAFRDEQDEASAAGDTELAVSLIDLCQGVPVLIERAMATFYDTDVISGPLFQTLRNRLERNLAAASGINYERRHLQHKVAVLPTQHRAASNSELIDVYFAGTPFTPFFATPVPFSIPERVRFEHTHILAGSGHGKTQTLQRLILTDLVRPDPPSLVIIDSQGEMLQKLTRLGLFDPDEGSLASRIVVIDPTDVEHPPALNMFDINQERFGKYNVAAREQILNGVIELYDYIFGALLGAELTQKQSVIFRYLARLMLTIPGATIHDLIRLMTDATPYLPAIEALPPSVRAFFTLEFSDKSFAATKKQILRRLWGILENPTFERMFTAAENRIDMFDALNTGKVVLVNTAKDFLKAERSSILGRYFIALTLQAALERAALPEGQRRPAFLYIDEAAEYFDDNIDDLLTQARKYNLGVVFCHQYLDQLTPSLRSSIAANTSIKLAGGVSDKDARSLASDMRTSPDFILGQAKQESSTRFACHIRNLTPSAISLTFPFGALESQPMMSQSAYRQLRDDNSARLSVPLRLETAAAATDAAVSPAPAPRPSAQADTQPQRPAPADNHRRRPSPAKPNPPPRRGDDWDG
jgi:hypothetical protein